MKYRKLRLAWSAMWAVLCAVIVVLWGRNFWWADFTWTPLPGGRQLAIVSADGHVECGVSHRQTGLTPLTREWKTYTASRNSILDVLVPKRTVIHYRVFFNGSFAIALPYWLLTAVAILLASVPWIPWSRRFTLRTLLIFTALVAFVLALAVTAGK
jgi:hypothetical protein